jgi:hypothetical protein
MTHQAASVDLALSLMTTRNSVTAGMAVSPVVAMVKTLVMSVGLTDLHADISQKGLNVWSAATPCWWLVLD